MAIAPAQVACLVLAAGRATRFGSDKLVAPLDGKPLLERTLTTLGGIGFAQAVVVRRAGGPDWAGLGFERCEVATPDAPQSLSLQTGLAALRLDQCGAVLLALGDMPWVSAAHIARLLAAFDRDDPHCVIASATAESRSPPALFGLGLIPHLLELEGDQGARVLLQNAKLIAAPASELADVDVPADLAGKA